MFGNIVLRLFLAVYACLCLSGMAVAQVLSSDEGEKGGQSVQVTINGKDRHELVVPDGGLAAYDLILKGRPSISNATISGSMNVRCFFYRQNRNTFGLSLQDREEAFVSSAFSTKDPYETDPRGPRPYRQAETLYCYDTLLRDASDQGLQSRDDVFTLFVDGGRFGVGIYRIPIEPDEKVRGLDMSLDNPIPFNKFALVDWPLPTDRYSSQPVCRVFGSSVSFDDRRMTLGEPVNPFITTFQPLELENYILPTAFVCRRGTSDPNDLVE